MPPNKLFPWVDLFRLAFVRGLAPDAVWSMTPAVLFKLLNIGAARQHMSREELESLMACYPDTASS